jgi:hypothetical protein
MLWISQEGLIRINLNVGIFVQKTSLYVITLDQPISDHFKRMITITNHNFLSYLITLHFPVFANMITLNK